MKSKSLKANICEIDSELTHVILSASEPEILFIDDKTEP